MIRVKSLCLVLVLIMSSASVFSQNYSNLKDIVLKDSVDYPKVEDKVLECAKFVLQTPLDNTNLNRLQALQFLLRWMEGTPNYTFIIDESVSKIAKENQPLIGVYIASMVKYVLETQSKNAKEVKLNSLLNLLSYCENTDNKVALNKELKKMIKVRNEGKLEENL